MILKKSNGHKGFFSAKSLRIQLLFRLLLILALLLVLVGLFQYVFMWGVIVKNKASSIQSQIMSIPRVAWQQIGTGGNNSDKGHPFFFIPEANLAFIDLKGNYSILSTGPGNMNPPQLDLQTYLNVMQGKPGLNYKTITDAGGEEQLVVLQPIDSAPGQMVGLVQVSTLTSPLRDLLIHQLLTFMFLALLALIFALLGFLPVLNKTLVPLFNMVDTAEQIDAGNLSRRFPTSQGQMEIDRLSESFNGMLERLEDSFTAERETKEQMRRFIADASHELRTPLTSIHGFLEVLLRGAVNQPDQLHKALVSMHGESKRLNKLVQDLLTLAKLDRTPYVELKEGGMDTLIREMEPQLRILGGNRRLSFSIEPNVNCKFDMDKIKQVILNLFHNAVQYTDSEKGEIQLSLVKYNDGVQLSIQDNGPGISEDHLPHLFDRFYRIDSSRTRKYGGSGLGLAITKSIIEAHGGTIWVESKEGEGCTFYILLPA